MHLQVFAPEKVKEAYDKTGLLPKDARYYDDFYQEKPCACAMGAMVASEFGIDELVRLRDCSSDIRKLICEKFNVSLTYVLGIERGFDNSEYKPRFSNPLDQDEFNKGYEDGQELRKQFIENGADNVEQSNSSATS